MEYKFTPFTPYQYMLINVANTFGLDKKLYPERIQWVKDNMNNLESFYDVADEPFLFMKAVKDLRDVQAGKPTGTIIRFDANCSGIQLLSVLTRCISGCKATGAINTDERPSAYTQVQDTMSDILGRPVIATYDAIKEAVMTSCYGSKKVPEDLFSGEELVAFHKACYIVAPGAFGMLNPMKNTWDKNAKAHSWVMPDNYHAHVPVMVTDIIKLTVEELGGYEMSTLITENRPKKYAVSNIANITHSIDGYVVRSLVRYCNYDTVKVKKLRSLIINELNSRVDESETNTAILDRLKELNLLDITIIDDIYPSNVHEYPREVLELLITDLNLMLSYEPFEVIPVHDCFGVSPLYMNQLRFWYNEILARLSNSNLLEDILSQLYKDKVNLKVFSEDISDRIRSADYPIN